MRKKATRQSKLLYHIQWFPSTIPVMCSLDSYFQVGDLELFLLHRAYASSSTTEAFNEECVKLRSIFSRLDYQRSLIDSVVSNFESRNPSTSIAERNTFQRPSFS